MAKKLNYIRPLLDAMKAEKLRDIVESYAKQDRSFEAFVLEQSGKAVETGKTYTEYHQELTKLLNKCSSRKYAFVKVTRLKKNGLDSFHQLLQSHFKNENFETALWMSLALMEMLHEAILQNTKYTWTQKPYKTFEKIFLETWQQFDSCMTVLKLQRKDRMQVFSSLIEMWWNERQREAFHHYIELDDIFRYVKRDADVIGMKETVSHLLEHSGRVTTRKTSGNGVTDFLNAVFSFNDHPSDRQLSVELEELDKRIQKQLEAWS